MIHKSNGFDGLRLIAAALVIFGHAFPLTGYPAPGFLGNGMHSIGVKIFFVISGFLITTSWKSDPNLFRFWIKRLLRILPGLIAICIVTVFAIGPLLTALTLNEYFASPGIWYYFWNVTFYPVYQLPGLFQGNVLPNAVNGSLWSLPVEVAMYCGVPVLIGRYRRIARVLVPAAATALFTSSIYYVHISPPEKHPIFWGTSLISSLDVAFYFYAGATIAVSRWERYCHPLAAGGIFCAAAWLVTKPIWAEIALCLTLPPVIIGIGQMRLAALRPLAGHDLSYGLYLYGFLCQQIVVCLGVPNSAALNAAISLPFAGILAFLSWRYVEMPALNLKPATPREERQRPAQHRPAGGAN